jgi:hypothetical protein
MFGETQGLEQVLQKNADFYEKLSATLEAIYFLTSCNILE